MSGINVNISTQHCTQVERHQNDKIRNPVVHQDQNAQLEQEHVSKRITMPVEPDTVENKKIDPEDRRREERRRKRSRKKTGEEKKTPSDSGGGEFIIDISV